MLFLFQMFRNCVQIRRLSEKGLHPTKESFLKSSVNRSRHEQVERSISSKVRIYKEGIHPSFICDEFFGKGSVLIDIYYISIKARSERLKLETCQ